MRRALELRDPYLRVRAVDTGVLKGPHLSGPSVKQDALHPRQFGPQHHASLARHLRGVGVHRKRYGSSLSWPVRAMIRPVFQSRLQARVGRG